jgi:hypothetical protein
LTKKFKNVLIYRNPRRFFVRGLLAWLGSRNWKFSKTPIENAIENAIHGVFSSYIPLLEYEAGQKFEVTFKNEDPGMRPMKMVLELIDFGVGKGETRKPCLFRIVLFEPTLELDEAGQPIPSEEPEPKTMLEAQPTFRKGEGVESHLPYPPINCLCYIQTGTRYYTAQGPLFRSYSMGMEPDLVLQSGSEIGIDLGPELERRGFKDYQYFYLPDGLETKITPLKTDKLY